MRHAGEVRFSGPGRIAIHLSPNPTGPRFSRAAVRLCRVCPFRAAGTRPESRGTPAGARGGPKCPMSPARHFAPAARAAAPLEITVSDTPPPADFTHHPAEPADRPLRLGEILVMQGVLSEQQAFEIGQAQKQCRKPFGVLAEEMFEVTIQSIEDAWVEQYHQFTGTLDLDGLRFDPAALRVINARQAWQFQMLPVRFESNGELLVAASRTRLARAVAFAASRLNQAVYFRLVESDALRRFLNVHFPIPGVGEEITAIARRLALPRTDAA